MFRQRRELLGLASSDGELHGLFKTGADLVAHDGSHTGLEQTRGDCHDADAKAGEISRHGEGHGCDGALAGSVSDLALLPVKGGGRGDHDDNAPLAIRRGRLVLGHEGECLAGEVDGSAEIDVEDKVPLVEAEGVAVTVEDLKVVSGGSMADVKRSGLPLPGFLHQQPG